MRTRERNSRTVVKGVTLLLAGLLGISLANGSVSALLQAESKNTSAQPITSGTLKITQANNGVGFSSTIADMAPGDVVNRYVNYTNTGTLASKALRLKVADASPTLLSTDVTRGLQLVVTDCSAPWNPATGACSATTTQLLSAPLASLGSDTAFTGITGLAENTGALHLQFSLTLPNAANNETTVNGVLPANTIQGLAAALTWTISETQRDATTSNA